MTLASSDIALISKYSVSDVSPNVFTTSVFNYLSSVAKEMLDTEDPGLASKAYDLAWGYLTVHLFESGKTLQGGLTSEKVGEYSYSRSVSGGTAYYDEYQKILALCRSTNGNALTDQEEGQLRADAQSKFDMDRSEVVNYYD